MRMKLLAVLAALALVSTVGAVLVMATETEVAESKVAETKMTVYKSPTCGCCHMWVGYLREHGFEVVVEDMEDVSPVKKRLGVPGQVWTCHTAVIGDYIVEGHVPFEAIDKLLAEKPAVRGIVLPGMPMGSPGMPGEKTETFVIYTFSDTGFAEFMKI